MTRTKLTDHGIHGFPYATDGENFYPILLTDEGGEEWRGHLSPCEVGPRRGRLPPSRGGRKYEIRAAELAASLEPHAASVRMVPCALASVGDDFGWRENMDGYSPFWRGRYAGWLARQIVEGDE